MIIYYSIKAIKRRIQIKKEIKGLVINEENVAIDFSNIADKDEKNTSFISVDDLKKVPIESEQAVSPIRTDKDSVSPKEVLLEKSEIQVEKQTIQYNPPKVSEIQDENAYIKDYKYKYEIYTDSFTKEKEIQWFIMDSYGRGIERRNEDFGCPLSIDAYKKENGEVTWFYNSGALHFHLRLKTPQLGIRFDTKNTFGIHKLSKGDTLSFLFDDESIIKYVLLKAPNNVRHKDNKEIRFVLTENDANKFATQLITKYRLDCANGDVSQVVDVKYKDRSQIIQHHFQVYLGILEECDLPLCELKENEEELLTSADKSTESCYVYLMHDESNGYYKIGISNHPKYREHTLQSEKPTIALVQAKQFPIRPIAEAFEAALHKTYESKRLRGEWFKLDSDDVDNLKKALL